MVRDHRRRIVLPVRLLPRDLRPRGRVLHCWTPRGCVPVRWAHRRSFGDLGAGEPVAAVGVGLLRAAMMGIAGVWGDSLSGQPVHSRTTAASRVSIIPLLLVELVAAKIVGSCVLLHDAHGVFTEACWKASFDIESEAHISARLNQMLHNGLPDIALSPSVIVS